MFMAWSNVFSNMPLEKDDYNLVAPAKHNKAPCFKRSVLLFCCVCVQLPWQKYAVCCRWPSQQSEKQSKTSKYKCSLRCVLLSCHSVFVWSSLGARLQCRHCHADSLIPLLHWIRPTVVLNLCQLHRLCAMRSNMYWFFLKTECWEVKKPPTPPAPSNRLPPCQFQSEGVAQWVPWVLQML